MFKTIFFTSILVSSLPVAALAQSSLAAAPANTLIGRAAPAVILVGSDSNSHAMQMQAGEFAPVQLGDLELSAAFVKAMMPGQPVGGGFVTINNTGKAADRLVSATTTADVDHVELHEMAMEGEIMRMRQLVDGIPLPAGQATELKPGGLHMMFMGVKTPFAAGEKIKVTLTFEKAGTVQFEMPVVDLKAQHKM